MRFSSLSHWKYCWCTMSNCSHKYMCLCNIIFNKNAVNSGNSCQIQNLSQLHPQNKCWLCKLCQNLKLFHISDLNKNAAGQILVKAQRKPLEKGHVLIKTYSSVSIKHDWKMSRRLSTDKWYCLLKQEVSDRLEKW